MLRALALLVLLLPHPLAAQDRDRTLTMTGTGYATALPDTLTARGFVNERDESAEKALANATRGIDALSRSLSSFGDVTATPVILRRDRAAGKRILGSDEITFLARGSVTLRLSDPRNAGRVLDAMVANGAGGSVSLEYGYEDRASLQQQARAAAVRDALDRATAYVEAADLTLGAVVDLRETSTNQHNMMGGAPDYGEQSYYSGKGASAPSVPGGGTATVTMTWALD